MNHKTLISTYLIILILVLSIPLFASDPQKVENFRLKDFNGKEHQLSDYKDSKAIVVMFIATECPVSNAYNKRMEEVYNYYKNKRVSFIGINSNKAESVSDIKAHAKSNNLTFTILKDDKNVIADKFGASVTPEIYILNSDFDVLYHGRIDDSQREQNVKSRDLQKALDDILSGRSVSVSKTKAFGCTIKRI